MRYGRILFSSAIVALAMTAVVPSLAAPPRRGPTSPKTPPSKHNKPVAHQTTIDPARATELQTALIKAGYLTGTPSGVWDAQAQAAMQKLQADNGWQTKLVPDSRAIIKLGLGPAQDNVAQVTPAPNPATN
jgi:Putative peptidoglycan binding domain